MWAELAAPFKSSGKEFNTLEQRIQNSHRRCEVQGVRRDADRIHDILDVQASKQLVDTHTGLIAYAELLFNKAFSSLSNQRALFILTDARARILALYSRPAIINAAAQQGVCLGASLCEASLGTSAVSLALHDFETALIHGAQHFCGLLHGWYCVAAPLRGANGQPIGCLDISTSDSDSIGETQALINFLAKDLEDYCKRNAVIDASSTSTMNESSIGALVRLTERQHQVLMLFSQGLSYKKIAQDLQLQSVKTIQEHLDAVRTKLGATNHRDCIRKAIEQGLI